MIHTDILILGKGPAGIQASIYAKRANLNPIVIGKDLGMSIRAQRVENFYGFESINGEELIEKGIAQAKNLGIEVISDEVVSLSFHEEGFLVKTLSDNYITKSFLFASGTHRNISRIRNVNKFEGKGVSYCAVCDAYFYKNKTVAVLGNSEYAASEVNALVDVCKEVYVFTNGLELDAQFDKRAIIIQDKVISVSGDSKVESIELEDRSIEVAGVFVALGTASTSDLAQKIGVVTERNRIVVNEKMETNIPGIYAAGDCTMGFQQIAKAVGDGCVAGMNMSQYIRSLKRQR